MRVTMNHRHRELAGWTSLLILSLVVVGVATDLLLYEQSSWTVPVTLEGDVLSVMINYRVRRGLIRVGHQFVVPYGEDRYTTTVQYPNGRKHTFVTDKQPRAVWEFNGTLYVACCNGRWLVGILDDKGLTPILNEQLPAGPHPWNLEEQTAAVQEEWDSEFESWLAERQSGEGSVPTTGRDGSD